MIGKCYNRLGQHDRAVPYLKKYLELAPDASDKAPSSRPRSTRSSISTDLRPTPRA